MTLDRREFLQMTAGGLLATSALSRLDTFVAKASYRAVAFDGFPIFDPRPVFALTETLFPGKGADLSNAWRTKQFEYQWLRALGGKYADFMQTTEDALVFAAKATQVDLTADRRAQLTQAYLSLKAWPDVSDALNTLKKAGLRLALLSNMTSTMLEHGITNAGLSGAFDEVIGTDRIKTFKPDPRAYALGTEVLKLKREEIVFAAFAGWDAAGAKWYGYPTVWVNRMNAPIEELSAAPDATGRDLSALTQFVGAAR